ncbi:MAG TPA: helicase-related protein, partial [Devosia sp.]|nr:helicase-related protein [Devosia sp.]
ANTPREERRRLGEALEAGRIKVIVNIATMTTGVDLDVRCLILARPTKSEMLYVQIIGRAMRSAPGKSDAIILDHSDTTLRLGFVTDIRHDALDDGSPKKKPEPRAARAKEALLPKECPSCKALKPAGIRKCPECGFEPIYREDVAVQQGDLQQLKGEKLADDRATKQRWWSGLAWYVEERGKTEQWAAWRYKDRFKVWPRGLRWLAKEPDVDVRNWVKASAIRWAKGAPARDQVKAGRSNVESVHG